MNRFGTIVRNTIVATAALLALTVASSVEAAPGAARNLFTPGVPAAKGPAVQAPHAQAQVQQPVPQQIPHVAIKWPTQERYIQAMRNPNHYLRDPGLKDRVELKQGNDGPLHWSGTFGTVFKGTTTSGRSYAIRVFHPGQKVEGVAEIQFRYERLQTFFGKLGNEGKLPTEIIPVAFVREGLKIDGERVPLMKTPWIEGREVDDWVVRRLDQNNPRAVETLADNFRSLVKDLRKVGIAHGDLHHRNIKIEADGAMRLLDYDSMFIPEFRGRFNSEVGHPNFQHPQYHFDAQGNFKASERPFNENMDNFSSIVIYTSLLAVSKDPGLWTKFHNENNIIFEGQRDYLNPAGSPVFAALRSSPSPRVQALAAKLATYAKMAAKDVPTLEEALVGIAPPPAVANAPAPSKPQAPPAALANWWKK